jgi:thioredoxin 1
MSRAQVVTSGNFAQEVLQADLPVVVEFWAEWCRPCRLQTPIVEELAHEFGGRARFARVNVDENRSLAGQYGVQSVPTLLVFVGAVAARRIVGFQPKEVLRGLLDDCMGSANG